MQRPFPALGIGWIIAVLVAIVAFLGAIGAISVAHLVLWLIFALALAILL